MRPCRVVYWVYPSMGLDGLDRVQAMQTALSVAPVGAVSLSRRLASVRLMPPIFSKYESRRNF